MLALLEHPGIHDAVAGGIQQFDSGFNRIALADRLGLEFHHIAVFDDQAVLGGDAHGLGRFGVGHQHAVFAMHGNKELGPGQGQHQLVVFLGAMARDMDAFALAINHLGSEHHQPVNGVHHRDGVARNRASREDDRVA